MIISSPAFGNNEPIPPKFTCDGKNISPPIEFYDVPSDADSLVLIMYDPDAPSGTFYHWVVWNINPSYAGIGEGEVQQGSVEGINSGGKIGYNGPCPPSGTHRYIFKLYAITGNVLEEPNTPAFKIEEEIKGRVVEEAVLSGNYERSA